MSAVPDAMAVAGDAEIKWSLSNRGAPIDELYLFDEDGALLTGPIAITGGAAYDFRHTDAITTEQLGAGGAAYRVMYWVGKGTESEQVFDRIAFAPILKQDPEPVLELSRELSSAYVEKGGELTVTYRLKNNGNVRLYNLLLSDPILSEQIVLDALDVGDRKTITRKLIVDKRMVSQPSATFEFEGGDGARTVTRESTTIRQASPDLELTLTASRDNISPGDTVALQLTLTNWGNVPFSKLQVESDLFGTVEQVPGGLPPSQSYTVGKSIQLKATTAFQFRVTGTSIGGLPVEQLSNEVTVTVTPVAWDAHLSVVATADQTRLSQPGAITFQIQLTNEGTAELRDVMLSEKTRGEIRLIRFMPGGALPPIEQSYWIDSDQQFEFFATMTDSDGGIMAAHSEPIDISLTPSAVPSEPVDAEDDPAAVPSPAARRYEPLFVAACGLWLILSTVYLAVAARRRRGRRKKADDPSKERK